MVRVPHLPHVLLPFILLVFVHFFIVLDGVGAVFTRRTCPVVLLLHLPHRPLNYARTPSVSSSYPASPCDAPSSGPRDRAPAHTHTGTLSSSPSKSLLLLVRGMRTRRPVLSLEVGICVWCLCCAQDVESASIISILDRLFYPPPFLVSHPISSHAKFNSSSARGLPIVISSPETRYIAGHLLPDVP
ncbi:hypothetical protein DFH94DRAFT_203824 [Russula ochroleuca]|uniref:Uncharacterized protein n=1 Tax=Russula ochroleuca TaxID=152965 RepID=A0A9P5MQS5_9AGAM|nr:hypothetical protein DFH94DRAFT_203824 [Russula ochroleuca]